MGSSQDHFWRFQRKCSSERNGLRRNTSGKCRSGGPTPHPNNLEFMTPPLFTHPLSIFVLAHLVLDSSHNLRMIHEGRTIVTILVSAARQSSASGKRLPGPAVMYSVLYLQCVLLPYRKNTDLLPIEISKRQSGRAHPGESKYALRVVGVAWGAELRTITSREIYTRSSCTDFSGDF